MATIETLLRQSPVVGILGARQVGKTTLARQVADRQPEPVTIFDLEHPGDVVRLADPMLALSELRGLVVLDEVQRLPGLFETLRVLVDRPDSGARFLVLGSASPDLLRQTSESLAGRLALHTLTGFSLAEVGTGQLDQLWLRGGFPPAYLAETDATSAIWRRDFVRTFLERDVPQLGVRLPAQTLRRFWTMLAHWHGNVWNASEFARSFGVSHTTVRRYLDLLTATYLVRLLPPWHENLRKRQVKAPKVYLADPGILHLLLGLETREALLGSPKMGASWEGLALETVIHRLGAWPEQCFFWRTHGGAELDLLVVHGERRLGFEFKRTSAPRPTRSIQVALDDLALERLDLVHAGEHTFPLADRVRAVAATRLLDDLEPLRPAAG